jgi:2-polyprenyl-3-methyl-5-hydroxy-6-metoxy-1,4-benzoquinol methylase
MEENKSSKLIAEKLATPDLDLLKKIKSSTWTSHNIPLTPSDSTIMNDSLPLIGDDVRVKVIKNNLHIFTGKKGSLAGLRLIDLGCLEGGISFEMAREDIDVLGVEGRESNYSNCLLIKEYFDLPNLDFQFLDVKNLNKKDHGVFDIVLCLGLLYHLDNPIDFLNILNEITHDNSMLFLDTKIAPDTQEHLENCVDKERLSGLAHIVHNENKYEGRWYREYEEAENGADRWASVSNYRSFWLTQSSLIKALYSSGFQNIYNIYGSFDITEEFSLRKKFSRLWCVAVKESFF